MRTLDNFIRGTQPTELVVRYKEYQLVKYGTKYFFMRGREVIDWAHSPFDTFYDRQIDILNRRNIEAAKEEIRKQPMYKRWCRFIKEIAEEDFSI